MSNTDTEAQDKIYIYNYLITYTICVYHTANANYICTWKSTSHISIYIYINIYIYDLHGPRHIQKTGPKLIAIEPKLIAIPSSSIWKDRKKKHQRPSTTISKHQQTSLNITILTNLKLLRSPKTLKQKAQNNLPGSKDLTPPKVPKVEMVNLCCVSWEGQIWENMYQHMVY
jgi:hypothetical protein